MKKKISLYYNTFRCWLLCIGMMGGLSMVSAVRYEKYAFLHCEDQYGAFLGQDTIRQTIDKCFFIKPPHFPYYEIINFKKEGTDLCSETDMNFEMIYRTMTYCGFDSLMSSITQLDLSKEKISVVLIPQDEEVNSDALPHWRVDMSGGKVRISTIRTTGEDAFSTWLLTYDTSSKQWSLYNEAANMFVTRITETEIQLGENDNIFFELEKSTVSDQIWKIKDPRTQVVKKMMLCKHNAHPYFGVTQQFKMRDEYNVEKEIRSDSLVLVDVDSSCNFNAPIIDGFTYKKQNSSYDGEHPKVNDHGFVTFLYEPNETTMIRTVQHSSTEKRIFDIAGRQIQYEPQRGLYIVNGKKQWFP